MSGPLHMAGSAEPVEVGLDVVVRPGPNGTREQTRTWIGELGAVQSKLNSLLRSGANEVRITQQPGSATATVSARYGSLQNVGQPEQAEESLTIHFNDTPIELHRHPNYVGISSARIKAVEELAESSTSTPPTDPAELEYYNLRLRGVQTYRVKMPVVTYTQTASQKFGGQLAVADAGLIYTTTQVSNRVSAPILFSIPSAPVGVSAGGDYIVGWLLDVQLQFLADGNVQLIETYEWGIWESVLYTAA